MVYKIQYLGVQEGDIQYLGVLLRVNSAGKLELNDTLTIVILVDLIQIVSQSQLGCEHRRQRATCTTVLR